jgi:hypothetical protein
MARLSLIHRSVRSSLFLAAVSCAASSAWAISPACGKNSLGSGAGNAAPAVACAKDETLAELLGFPVRPGLASGLAAEARAGALPEPAGVAEASAASAPSDEERADATRTIKTSDHVLVRAESSYGTIIHEAQVKVSAETIENTAGTFGDPSRYFQVLPGVVSDNDQRNDMLVRGGSPTENLFVIDGIVIPSINHLALSDTTGGFVSMIDNNAIECMTLGSRTGCLRWWRSPRFRSRASRCGASLRRVLRAWVRQPRCRGGMGTCCSPDARVCST